MPYEPMTRKARSQNATKRAQKSPAAARPAENAPTKPDMYAVCGTALNVNTASGAENASAAATCVPHLSEALTMTSAKTPITIASRGKLERLFVTHCA